MEDCSKMTEVTEIETEEDFEEPPKNLVELLVPFWYLSSEIRETLTSPAWKARVEMGKHPFICFHDGFCSYYDSKQRLNEHYNRKPDHNLSGTEMAQQRRKGFAIREQRLKAKREKSGKSKSPEPTPYRQSQNRQTSSRSRHRSSSSSSSSGSSRSTSRHRRSSRSPSHRSDKRYRSSRSPSRHRRSSRSSSRHSDTRYRRSSRSPSRHSYRRSSRSPSRRSYSRSPSRHSYRRSSRSPSRYSDDQYRSNRSPTFRYNDNRFRPSCSPLSRRSWRRTRSRSPSNRYSYSRSSSSGSSRSPPPSRRRPPSPKGRPPSPTGPPPPQMPYDQHSNVSESCYSCPDCDQVFNDQNVFVDHRKNCLSIDCNKNSNKIQNEAIQDGTRISNVPSDFPASRIPSATSLPVQRPPAAITTTTTANGQTTLHPSVTKSMSFSGVMTTTTTTTNGSSKRTMDDIIRNPLTSTPLLMRSENGTNPNLGVPQTNLSGSHNMMLDPRKRKGSLELGSGNLIPRQISIVRPISKPNPHQANDSVKNVLKRKYSEETILDVPSSPASQDEDVQILVDGIVPIKLTRNPSEGDPPTDPRKIQGLDKKPKEVVELLKIPNNFAIEPEPKVLTASEKWKKKQDLLKRVRKNVKSIANSSSQPTQTPFPPPTPFTPFPPPTPLDKESPPPPPSPPEPPEPPVTSKSTFPSRQLSAPAVLQQHSDLQHQFLPPHPPVGSDQDGRRFSPPQNVITPPPVNLMVPPPALGAPLLPNLSLPPPNFRPPHPHPYAPVPPLPTPDLLQRPPPPGLVRQFSVPDGPPPVSPTLAQSQQPKRDPRLVTKPPSSPTTPPEPQMDPSRQHSLSKLGNSMSAFTSYSVLPRRLTGTLGGGAAGAVRCPPPPSLSVPPTRSFLFEQPRNGLPSAQQLFGSLSDLSIPTGNIAPTATQLSPTSCDPRKRNFSSDDQLDEFLSKKNRANRPSSWVVTKQQSMGGLPPKPPMSEEEIKKQKEIEIKANALRERLLVKKNPPQPLMAMVLPKPSDVVITSSPQSVPLRVPSPPPAPKFIPQVKDVKQEVNAKNQIISNEPQSVTNAKNSSTINEVKINEDSPLRKPVSTVKESKTTTGISNDVKNLEEQSKLETKSDLKQSKLSDVTGKSETRAKNSEIISKGNKSGVTDEKKGPEMKQNNKVKEKQEEAKQTCKVSNLTAKNEDGKKGVIISLKETLAAAAAKSSLANKDLKNSVATTSQVKAVSSDNARTSTKVAKQTNDQKDKVDEKKIENIKISQNIQTNTSKVTNSSPKNAEDDTEVGCSLQETLKALSKDSPQSEVPVYKVVDLVVAGAKPVEPLLDKNPTVCRASSLLETLRELQESEEKSSSSIEIEKSVTSNIVNAVVVKEVEEKSATSVQTGDKVDRQIALEVVKAIASEVVRVISNQLHEDMSSTITETEKPNLLVSEVVKNLSADVEKMLPEQSDISVKDGDKKLKPVVLIPIKKHVLENPNQNGSQRLEETIPGNVIEKTSEQSKTDSNESNSNQGKESLEKEATMKVENKASKPDVIESEQESYKFEKEEENNLSDVQLTMSQLLSKVDQKVDEIGSKCENIVVGDQIQDPVKIQENLPIQVKPLETPIENPIQSQVEDSINALDPFELGNKFSNNFNMFRSTVVGISSAADNESFLTNALKNFSSSSRIFDPDEVESGIEVREETVLSTLIGQPSQSRKEGRHKHKRKKSKRDDTEDENDRPISKSEFPVRPSSSIPRKKVKITVYEESADEIDDVTDMTITKHKGAKRGPKPGSSKSRKGLKPQKEVSLSEDAAVDYDSDCEPLIIEAGKCKSIDHCPRCKAGLNALSGGYTINVATMDVTVTCVSCRRLIIIKNSFSDLKAFEP